MKGLIQPFQGLYTTIILSPVLHVHKEKIRLVVHWSNLHVNWSTSILWKAFVGVFFWWIAGRHRYCKKLCLQECGDDKCGQPDHHWSVLLPSSDNKSMFHLSKQPTKWTFKRTCQILLSVSEQQIIYMVSSPCNGCTGPYICCKVHS